MARVELIEEYRNHEAGEQLSLPATVARSLKFKGIAKDIKPDPGEEYPVHKGAGYYELSNGEKVRGKDEAIKAENELNS